MFEIRASGSPGCTHSSFDRLPGRFRSSFAISVRVGAATPDSFASSSRYSRMTRTVVATGDRPHPRVPLQRRRIHAQRLAAQQTVASSLSSAAIPRCERDLDSLVHDVEPYGAVCVRAAFADHRSVVEFIAVPRSKMDIIPIPVHKSGQSKPFPSSFPMGAVPKTVNDAPHVLGFSDLTFTGC